MIQKSVKFLFEPIKVFIKLLILCSTLNVISAPNIYADSPPEADPGFKGTIQSVMDTISRLTCETQGLEQLLVRSKFSHTCIELPVFTFAIANLLSPGLYIDTLTRLKINDPELFDSNNPHWKDASTNAPYIKNNFPGGQCARNNKIPYGDGAPKLTFAICNNKRLTEVNLGAIAQSILALAKAALTNTDPWNDMLHIWRDSKLQYHDLYSIKDGETIFTLDLPPVWIKGRQFKDTMCITVKGVTWSDLPVGCKYISEPYPKSIYQSFINPEKDATERKDNDPKDPMKIVDCGLASPTCYQRAYNNSKTAIVITAPLIECFKEMTARLLLSREVCTFDAVNQVINSNKRDSSIFFQFQRKMHRTVTALLTLYVMFFGGKLLLAGDIPPKKDIINFVLKMLFVTYFSVGININPGGGDNDYGRLDGMIQWAFPLLLGGIDTLAGWVMNAAPSELCKFDASLIYDPKLAYMPLWDALDCRISHYLGLDMLSTLLVKNSSKGFDFFSFSAPPYVYLLIPAIISGNMTLISLALAYPLLVISVGAFMINATIMCMISIVILGVLAPLFVPMLLFEYTRGYFEAWVKLLISFLLQPMVVVTFMILMFSVYDFGFYGHCKYKSTIIENSIEDAITGNISPKRKVKIFVIDNDNDWRGYSDEEKKSCQNSLGYLLNYPLTSTIDFTKTTVETMVKDKPGTKSTKDYMNKFSFLGGVTMEPGMFFEVPKMIFEKIKDMILALITACFTLYLMYHFSAQLASFAADMTEGVALHNVAINPQAIFKAGMAAAAAAKGMMAADKAAGGLQGPKDMQARGGGGAGSPADAVSTPAPVESGPDDTSSVGSSGAAAVGSGRNSGLKRMPSSVAKDHTAISHEDQDIGTSQGSQEARSEQGGEGIQDLPIVRSSLTPDKIEGKEQKEEATEPKKPATIEAIVEQINKAKETKAKLSEVSPEQQAERSEIKDGALSERSQKTAEPSLQPGQQGYAEQEIKNQEIANNAKLNAPVLEKEQKASSSVPNSPPKPRETLESQKPRETLEPAKSLSGRDKTNIKEDGNDENS